MALLLGPVPNITLEIITEKGTSLEKWNKIFQEDILACKCYSFVQYFVKSIMVRKERQLLCGESYLVMSSTQDAEIHACD